jgi:hypothetical protein
VLLRDREFAVPELIAALLGRVAQEVQSVVGRVNGR